MKLFRVLLSMLLLTVLSCNIILPKEEDTPEHTFKDQDLQGTIAGESFLFKTGIADIGDYQITGTLYDIEVYYLQTIDDTTKKLILVNDSTIAANSQLQVKFTVPKDTLIHEIEWPTFVTFTGKEIAGELHANSGVIQITSFDEETGMVEGRIDLTMGDDTELNGNFTAIE